MEQKTVQEEIESSYTKLTVPYSLLDFAVRKNRFTSVQVYLAAKFLFKAKFFDKDVHEIAELIGKDPKTVRSHIGWLADSGWLQRNRETGVFHIRKWTFIQIRLDARARRGYFFFLSRIRDFKAFAIAATYDRLIALQKYKRWRKNRESVQKGSSKQTGLNAHGYYPVANSAYCKIFGISESTASRYRQLAKRKGFIKTLEPYKAQPIPTNDKLVVRIYKEEFGKQLVYRRKRYCTQEITLVNSMLTCVKISLVSPEKTASIKKGNV